MIKKILNILSFQIRIKILLIFFFYLLSIFLDLLGISIIPIFIATLFSSDLDVNNKFYPLVSYFKLLDLNLILLLIISIFVSKNILQTYMIYYEQRLLSNFYLKNTKKLMKFYFNKNFLYFTKMNPTFFVRNIVNESKVLKNTILNYLSIFRDIVLILGIIIILATVNFNLTLIVFVLFLITYLSYNKLIKQRVKNKSEKNMSLRAILSKTILEYFNSIIDIKLAKKEDFLISEYQKFNKIYEKNDIELNLLKRIPKFLLEILSILIICLSIMKLVRTGVDTSEILVLVSILTLSILKLLPAFISLSINIVSLKINKPSIDLISRELEDFNKLGNYFKALNKSKITNIDLKRIKFEKVEFSYDEKKKVISELNLQLEAKKFIGITGSSGSGKTTFLNLLTGIIEPTNGKILINDSNLNEIKYDWFDNISYVSQNSFLLDGSIQSNITFGVSENKIDHNLLKNVVKNSCIDEFISDSLALNTIIGNNGAKISGGQKQRIAIARALYRKPQILILDEAMNAMDDELQNIILKNLKNLSFNLVIMVTHEEKLLNICDKKYLLKENVIREI